MSGKLESNVSGVEVKPICGIVMPISEIDGCSEKHWNEVKSIIEEAIDNAGFQHNLVSNSEDVGIIHQRIVQNLYENPLLVCDVSGKNPNVMFELGIRLTFDKPTIIIKDDVTKFSFDTSPIEHLGYPRDLRYGEIVNFKKLLSGKIISTHKKASEDENYSTFLKHFGPFKKPIIDTQSVSKEDFILEELRNLKESIYKTNSIYAKRAYTLESSNVANKFLERYLSNYFEVIFNLSNDYSKVNIKDSLNHVIQINVIEYNDTKRSDNLYYARITLEVKISNDQMQDLLIINGIPPSTIFGIRPLS